ncbi:MAG: hypothetical protein RLZZ58_1687 [Pseudomonadota bacterium]
MNPKILPVVAALALMPAACSQPAPPDESHAVVTGAPLAAMPVKIGTEGPQLPACASVSRVIAAGTDAYWAPGEIRAVKARLVGGAHIALCEARDNDQWFGVIFPAPGTDMDLCNVGRPVTSAREYQGPCRWGWIKGGTVQLGG